MKARERLDKLLVDRGLAETRARAQALILAGAVRVGGEVARRAALPVMPDAAIALAARLPYVSRGGVKLAHALDVFGVDPRDAVVADVGASTGGFTDCLLQRGAACVYAVDVGYGQLDARLRADVRVVVMERTHARDLVSLPELVDASVIDVSFISVRAVLPTVVRWCRPGAWIVALVKPQFEAGRDQVPRGGVVIDPTVHRAVLVATAETIVGIGWGVLGVTASPIRGPAGNREFFIHAWDGAGIAQPAIEDAVELAVGGGEV
jgi:23S rRNA (cytidine1920-2'-O)/16S rRNA (cytidine1409-2'-O)-methyltransferase